MKQQILLLQDVESLGKKGDIVTARPGYIRNCLFPNRLAVRATPNTLRKQETLKQQRLEQAAVDRKESEEIADQVKSLVLEIHVKVDPEGHMYGSVSAGDIARLIEERGIPIDKKSVRLPRAIKQTGKHTVHLFLKEGIESTCELMILAENASPGAASSVSEG